VYPIRNDEAVPSSPMLRVCPLCEADNRPQPPHLLSAGPWRLKRCAECGLVYLENPPGYQALQEQFAWERSMASRERARSRQGGLVRRLRRRIGKVLFAKRNKLDALARRYVHPGRLIDVGCGDGRPLASVRGDYQRYGVEVSRELAARAREALEPLGGRVIESDAVSALADFPDEYFQGAVMDSYLEHELYPLQALHEMHRTLAPGGHVLLKVPNFASWLRFLRGACWCGLRFPDHVNYFTPSTFRALLEKAGFRIVRSTLADRSPLGDNMWCVAAKDAIASFAGSAWERPTRQALPAS
jgi:SAM-dependent methyltransferase